LRRLGAGDRTPGADEAIAVDFGAVEVGPVLDASGALVLASDLAIS
jgi:hypothetical protein